MKQLLLGKTLCDAITGFTGVATTYTQFDNGTEQYGLQPTVDSTGKLPEPYYVDAPTLSVVEGERSVQAATPDEKEFDNLLGTAVKDKVSGFTGTSTRRTVFINGCVYYSVVGGFNNRTGKADEMFLQADRLIWESKADVKATSRKSETEQPDKRIGGPAFTVPSRM